MTELWLRNPQFYIRELRELQIEKIFWDGGFLAHNKIDPVRFMNLHYGNDAWRMIVTGYGEDQTVVIAKEHTSDSQGEPVAVHPVWKGDSEPLSTLESYCMQGLPRVIIDLGKQGDLRFSQNAKYLTVINEVQKEYPDTIVHLHNQISFRYLFGMDWRAVDYEGRIHARKGQITLGNGKSVAGRDAAPYNDWLRLNGFTVSDFDDGSKRCLNNVKSAMWAARFFKRDVKFVVNGAKRHVSDALCATLDYAPPENSSIFMHRVEPGEGDKFLCDTCHLQTSCKYYRTGAVCAVPDSEPTELAKYFNTRSSDVIIEGLGTLLATQTRRLELGIIEELNTDKLNPEVTKILNSIFDRGVKLAKLVNPSLAAAGAAQVNVTTQVLNAQTPQSMIAGIVAELELQGIPRDRITPEMIENLLGGFESARQKAIEAAAVEKEIIEIEEMGCTSTPRTSTRSAHTAASD